MRELPAWLARDADISGAAKAPRMLLLTQVFPPHTEIGAARWEGFAPFLGDAGWGMDVITEDPMDVANPDWERFRLLPQDIRVAVCQRRRPAWYEALRRVHGAASMTRTSGLAATAATSVADDTSVRSVVRRAVSALIRAQQSHQLVRQFAAVGRTIVDGRHKIVVSSGPGHYVHVAGARVAHCCKLLHVIDLRDPWGRAAPTVLERILPDEALCRHETVTLRRAALIITNTNAAGEVLARRFPELRDRVRCIPNGSDIGPVLEGQREPRTFQIAHCGSLYIDRDPRPFLKAVALARSRLHLRPADLRVVFMGEPARIGGRSLTELASEAGIGDLFEERPSGSREQARRLLRESLMAVAFQGETRTQVPGKIFEYVAFPLWLLALVGKDSATADVLAGSDAIVLDIDDVAGIAASIEECYARFREGLTPRPVGYDGRFSRATQAERLILELQRLVA